MVYAMNAFNSLPKTVESSIILRWIVPVLGLLSAVLMSAGLIMWIAANWDHFEKMTQFGLLEGLIILFSLISLKYIKARVPLLLFVFFIIGGLWAFFGQTYQTGADPWQLFALWAVLSLPLCLASRSDFIWSPWVILFNVAIVFWVHAFSKHQWDLILTEESVMIPMIGLLLQCALLAVLMLQKRFFKIDSGIFSFRIALFITIISTLMNGIFFVVSKSYHHFYYFVPFVLLILFIFIFSRKKYVDLFGLILSAFFLNVLFHSVLTRGLFQGYYFRSESDMLFASVKLLFIACIFIYSSSKIISFVLKFYKKYQQVNQTNSNHFIDENAEKTSEIISIQNAKNNENDDHKQHWLAVLLVGLGAWLSFILLTLSFGLVVGFVFKFDTLIIGFLGLAKIILAYFLLKQKNSSLFKLQFSFPLLLLGECAFIFCLHDYFHFSFWHAAFVFTIITTICALNNQKPIVNMILGFVSGLAFIATLYFLMKQTYLIAFIFICVYFIVIFITKNNENTNENVIKKNDSIIRFSHGFIVSLLISWIFFTSLSGSFIFDFSNELFSLKRQIYLVVVRIQHNFK